VVDVDPVGLDREGVQGGASGGEVLPGDRDRASPISMPSMVAECAV